MNRKALLSIVVVVIGTIAAVVAAILLAQPLDQTFADRTWGRPGGDYVIALIAAVGLAAVGIAQAITPKPAPRKVRRAK